MKLENSDDGTNEDATHQQSADLQSEADIQAAAVRPPDPPIRWAPFPPTSPMPSSGTRFVPSTSPSPLTPWTPANVSPPVAQDAVEEDDVDGREEQDADIQLAATVAVVYDSDRTQSLSEWEVEQQREQEVDEYEGGDASIVVDNADDPSTILGQVHYWHVVNQESDITPTQSEWDEQQENEAAREAARLASADTVSDTE